MKFPQDSTQSGLLTRMFRPNRRIFAGIAVCLATAFFFSVVPLRSDTATVSIEPTLSGSHIPTPAPSTAGPRPNIVLILADDLGWRDVGYHQSNIKTPRIDELAAGGLELDRFYVQPTCSPTRAALLTGQSSLRHGIFEPISKYTEQGLPLDLHTLPQYFQEAGYQTFMSGKWHLGHSTRAQHPNARGFDHFYGFLRGGIGYWDHVHGGGVDWQRNGTTVREEGYSTHLLAKESVKLIEQRDPSRPFFLYASFNAPHMPNEAPAASVEEYSHLTDNNRRVHAAMVTELDRAIGQIVDTLSQQGLMDNTLIWFMSDNGGLNESAMPDNHVKVIKTLSDWFTPPLPIKILEFARTNMLDSASDNTPLRKGKTSVYEGGVRVPALLYWQGQLSPKTIDARISVQDVLPTLAEAAGLALRPNQTVDGVSQWPLLKHNQPTPSSDWMVHGRDGEAYLQDNWKLILPKGGEPELFDLEQDPTETNNVATANPMLVSSLRQKIETFPRGENIAGSLLRVLLDPDLFGGEEDREPWAEQIK